MANSTIEQELERQDYILLQTTGISMEPLLHNRKSTVVIISPPKMLKRYDVVLFRRISGEYVLHRVLKAGQKIYLICGDNEVNMEPVAREQILGVMEGYYPDEGERYISCNDLEYQRYLRTVRVRYWVRWWKALLVRVWRNLTR